jgi:ABC-2 type transport system permease protein
MQSTLGQPTYASQWRAILAVAHKEWIIFRRYPSWVLAVLIWPILLPLAYILSARALSGPDGASLGQFEQLAGTRDYVSFIVIGSMLWGWLNMTLWDVGFFMRNEQMRGTLESNWLCPVPRISIMLGGSLNKLLISLGFLAITVLQFRVFLGVEMVKGNAPLLVLVLALLIPIIYGIGITFGSLVLRFKEANAMVFLVRGIFMIFCGMTYPVAVLPEWMQAVAAWLPLTYAIHATRAIVLQDATLADLRADLLPLAAFAIVLPILGYLAFNYIVGRARQRGDLGEY